VKSLFRIITALFMTLCMIAGMTGLPATACAAGLDDAAIVAADKEALAIGFAVGDSVYGVKDDLTLPLSGASGSTVTWLSDTPAVIAHDGTVTRAAAGGSDAEVTLTATITYGEAGDTKAFTVTVLKEEGGLQMLMEPMDGVIWQGSGTEIDPYQVASADHLDAARDNLSAYYVQTADIDLALAGYNNWTPFGTYAAPFTAHYDGGGYVISGLTVTGSNNNASLFGFVSGNAVIENVRIQDAAVTGNLNVGILAGIIADGGGATGGATIQNCSTSGTVSGSARVGGLIGAVQHGSAVVKESFSTAAVSADPANSSQRGTAGGLAGFVLSGLVQDCYASGRVTAGRYTGGFAGEMQGGTARYCYANVPAAGTYPGGFLGYRQGSPTVADCFYDSDAAGTTSSAAGTAKTTAEMRRLATFTNWNFDSVWSINEDVFYPILRYYDYVWTPDDRIAADLSAITWDLIRGENTRPEAVTGDLNLPLTGGMESAIAWGAEPAGIVNAETGTVARPADADATIVLTATVSYAGGTPRTKTFTLVVVRSSFNWEGDGSAEHPYEVSSADHLDDLRNIMGSGVHFIQTANIDLSGYVSWTPIGTSATPFTGIYDGKGYTIENLAIDRENEDFIGLFGKISGGTVDDLHITGAVVKGKRYVGILAGRIENSGKVTLCSAAGSVTAATSGEASIGGLVGEITSGCEITKSYSLGTVAASDGYRVGGLVGNSEGAIKECFSSSAVNGRQWVGGLVGSNWEGYIGNSYATGDVHGYEQPGGLAGVHGSVAQNTVMNSYSTGEVTGTNNVGGLFGTIYNGAIINCYYDKDSSGRSDTGKGTPKDTGDMKKLETFTGWDFGAIWKIGEGISYPALQWQGPWTDDEIISTDLAALKWDDIKGGNIGMNFVTGNLAQFPVTGLKGAAITWSAAPTGYIDTATGALIKREQTADVTVTLTAEASYGAGAARTRAFVLTVKMLELERYAVVYDANGGTGTPPTESDRAENEPFQAAAADNLQPPEAMRFKEWNTAANGTGAGYGAGATVTMPGNALTLYAIWEIVWIGNGSSQSPFQVPSAAHLDAVRHNMGAHYILTADIDLPAAGYTNWEPIGANNSMFTGVFNGNGKSITGLTIDRSGTDYQGLFGAIGSGGLVKNLGVADVSVTGNRYVGGVTGRISGGKVESCYVSGSVRGNGSVGGIVGRFSTGEVRNCYSESDVSGSGSNIGGVAGEIQNGQMFLCYATGNVSGNSFAGGVAGRMLNEGIVMLCAALNPRVTAAGNGGSRVINVPGTRTDDNYAFNGMTVTANGAAKAIKAGVRLADGENLSFDSLFSESFWNGTLFFNTSTIWLIEDYKLPVLRNIAGQDGAPPHLIKLFVDAAKNAAEGAAYSDMAQAAATGEAAITNALQSEAEAAVNNSSVTVTVNKVSYTPPVAGDSASPDGTNGSFVFTVTVARDSQDQTTTQKSITITATPYTGVTDVQAVAAAKAALTDGSVNVAFGASQSDKTEAVQSYVNGLLSAVPNAAGVTANVTYNGATGRYEVALSKGSTTGSTSLTMSVNEAPDPDIAIVGNAKTAAENAAYSDMTQAAASSENAIKTALRNTAVTAVNSGSVDVAVNTVSYLVPVAGTSANPSGTNGSYTFTITVSKGWHSQTTTQKTISIAATAYTSPSRPGRGSSAPSGILVPPTGKDIADSGVSMSFPAGAVESDIRVQVREAALTSGMRLPDDSRLISKVVDIVKNRSGNFAQPVTITMSFNKSQVDPEKYDIKICCFDEQSGEWVELDNIKVDLDGSTVSGQVNHFTKLAVIATLKADAKEEKSQTPAPQPEIKLPADIANHWAKDSIAKLMQAGVIGGYPDGSFQPEKSVSRAEFTVMLVKALKLEAKQGSVFKDTAAHWAKDSINTAAAHGIISGYDQNSFGPDDQITREQAAVITARATKLQAGDQALSFSDAQQISPWALSGVAAAVGNSYLRGYPDNSFRPQGYTSRAEAAAITAKLLY